MSDKVKRKPWTARRIHLWIAVILAMPMLLVSVSGILIAMRSISTIKVPMVWLGAESVPSSLPANAFLVHQGISWVGNAQGVFRVQNAVAEPIAHFAGLEVIGLAVLGEQATPLIATRMAIWHERQGKWVPAQRGRVRQLASLPDGRVLAIIGGRGEMADSRPWVTNDGVNWETYLPAIEANRALPALENPEVALSQWMRELHSGAFFFGKGPGEMIWSNLLGWVLVVLTLTGLWIWWKTERAKLLAKRRREAQQARHSDTPIHAQGGKHAG